MSLQQTCLPHQHQTVTTGSLSYKGNFIAIAKSWLGQGVFEGKNGQLLLNICVL
jgi:hypothetical protein